MTSIPGIRSASNEDVPALIELSIRTIRESYSPFLGEDAVAKYIGGGHVETFAKGCIQRATVILLDDAVVGYGAANGDLLELLMIDHRVHRHGFGRALLFHVESAMFEKHERIRLESFANNAVANTFYLANGWVEAGRHVDAEWGIRMIDLAKLRE